MISGLKWLRSKSFVKLFKLYVKKGEEIKPIENHPSRAGIFIVSGSSIDGALKNAESVYQNVKIIT